MLWFEAGVLADPDESLISGVPVIARYSVPFRVKYASRHGSQTS